MRIQVIYNGNTYDGCWKDDGLFEEELEQLPLTLLATEYITLTAPDGTAYFMSQWILKRSVIRLIP